MSMQDLEKAFKILNQSSERKYISGPKSEELIRLAEKALGLKFPPTYRLFLHKYGCGGVRGLEIYGLTKEYSNDFNNLGSPNGIWLTLDERKDDYLPHHFIIISDTGDGYWYCLDASQPNDEGEYSVVVWGLDMAEKDKEKVAEDFGEFLLNELKQRLDIEE